MIFLPEKPNVDDSVVIVLFSYDLVLWSYDCNGSQLMNPDISGALYTLRIQHLDTQTQREIGARESRVH